MKNLSLLLALFFCACFSQAQTPDEIIALHLKALGEAQKLESITSLIVENTMESQMGEFSSTQTILTNKAYQQELQMMGDKMIFSYHNELGSWMIKPAMMGGKGPEELPEDQKSRFISMIDPRGVLYEYTKKGILVEFLGKETVGDKELYKLKVSKSDLKELNSIYYINSKTYLIDKMDLSLGKMNQTTMRFSNYKPIDGFMMAHTIEMNVPRMGEMTITLAKATLNSSIEESIFKKPNK